MADVHERIKQQVFVECSCPAGGATLSKVHESSMFQVSGLLSELGYWFWMVLACFAPVDGGVLGSVCNSCNSETVYAQSMV
jgi:hypothetical protein